MPEQFLHGPDVIAGREQVRRKRVPKRVAGDAFGKPRGAGGVADRTLDGAGVQMVPPRDFGLSVPTGPLGREYPVPRPVTPREW